MNYFSTLLNSIESAFFIIPGGNLILKSISAYASTSISGPFSFIKNPLMNINPLVVWGDESVLTDLITCKILEGDNLF